MLLPPAPRAPISIDTRNSGRAVPRPPPNCYGRDELLALKMLIMGGGRRLRRLSGCKLPYSGLLRTLSRLRQGAALWGGFAEMEYVRPRQAARQSAGPSPPVSRCWTAPRVGIHSATSRCASHFPSRYRTRLRRPRDALPQGDHRAAP
jgi:hypothetical protein